MPNAIQRATLTALEVDFQVDSVSWKDETDTPRYIHGRLSKSGEAPADSVHDFLAKYGAIYGIDGGHSYRIGSIRNDSRGNTHLRVGRMHRGFSVIPSRLTITCDPDGVIMRIKADWPYAITLPEVAKPEIDLEKALAVAEAHRSGKDRVLGVTCEPRVEYLAERRRGRWRAEAVWNLVARFAGSPETEGFLVSTSTGRLARRYADVDQAGTTTTGTGINVADETAATPVLTLNVNDPGGGAKLELLDTSRSVDIETRDMAGSTNSAGTFALCSDDDSDGVFSNITNNPRGASDRPEVAAHYNTGLIHDYFARNVTTNGINLFNRTGWKNDPAQKWISLVHRATDDNGSFYSRSAKLTTHGDGDGVNLTYKPSLDICGHEWSHAVSSSEITGTNPNGGYNKDTDENFVLSEGSADWWACCISKDGWRFGAVFADDVAMAGATHTSTGARYRGMEDPNAFGQPDHYQAGGDTGGTGFGVGNDAGAATALNYRRLGILGKAGFLAAAGGTHPVAATDPATYPPIPVYGMGVTSFENILYYAQINWGDGADQFADIRQDLIDAANLLYPGSCKPNTLEKAFDAVGIYASGGNTPPVQVSGPDPMITPWGAATGAPPYWQSPDIYVKDAAGTIVDPVKGQINRLFANVSNVGDMDALGVDVTFSFKPYGAGTSGNAEKVIGTVTVGVPISPPSTEVEIAWDLTDLTDTNGGVWPLPLGDFDHFCVIVRITHADDVDVCNNLAQNNFGNVGTAGDGDGVSTFLVGNSSRHARWIGLIPDHRIDSRWEVRLDLTRLLDRGAGALNELRETRPGLPWLADTPGAVTLPLRGGELRPVTMHWRIKGRDSYRGDVYGCLSARVSPETKRSAVDGMLLARIRRLELKGGAFTALIVGRVTQPSGQRAKTHDLAVRGTLVGKVDRETGRLSAKFEGVTPSKGREKKIRFSARGEMAASASFSFAVIGDDDQGIDLAVPLVGNLGHVCGELRPRLPKRHGKRPRPRKPRRRSAG